MEYRIHLTNKHFFSKWSQTSNHTCYDVHVLNSTMCMYSIYCTAQRKLWLSTEIYIHMYMYPWSKRINICTYYWNRNHANTLTIKALGCHERWRPCISWQVWLCSFYLLRHTKICDLMDTHFSQPCNEHHIKKATPWMYVHTWTAWHVHV